MYKMDSYCNHVPMLQFPIRLDLGAGQYPQPGFVRMDMDPLNVDIRWDVTNGIPLPNGSVSELYTSHFLEHLLPTDLHYVLQEMWRVCTDGAKVTIKVPHGDTPEGRLPCHYNFWNEDAMQAVHNWFPHEGHPSYNGNYWDVQRVWRDGIHLIGEFLVRKGLPV
jgi:predicted SAM-dependent methyltransferase